ncbi:hypothetical protein SAMN02927895_00865 [Belnapia rosea]|nr:hypothetical protein SAMN02927895_00865 [Belnapia rosea]
MSSCCFTNRRPEAPEGTRQNPEALPVAIIGGPVGLAAAAHLLERGLEPVCWIRFLFQPFHPVFLAPA